MKTTRQLIETFENKIITECVHRHAEIQDEITKERFRLFQDNISALQFIVAEHKFLESIKSIVVKA